MNIKSIKSEGITLTLTNEEMQPLTIVQLYNLVGEALGYDVDKVNYDCTKIDVSKDIADLVEEKYKQIGKEQGVSENSIKMSFGMDWCCYGPKALEELPDRTIVITYGFIKAENEAV